MNLLSILLDSAAPSGGGSSPLSGVFMILIVFVIFYFFMMRPQQKKQKEVQKAREALKPGDKIVTSGGLYGKVKDISDKYLVVEITENVRVRVDKNSVFAVPEEKA